MTVAGQRIVFVHGNPETEAIWAPLLAALAADAVTCLSPPGFGAPVPAGFGCTVLEYRDWLVTQLEALGEPVHLVGHDWGGGHVVNVAMSRPDLLLSWASDSVGLFHPGYVWHRLAQQWQQLGEGASRADELFSPDAGERADVYAARGIDASIARRMAEAQGEQMGRAILALYRSARQPVMSDLGGRLAQAAARPGLCLIPTEDDFVGTTAQRHEAAGTAGARTQVLDGRGHWWMVEDPAGAADVLQDFWHALPS